MRQVETGELLDRFPYARAGTGPETLVVLPGVGDSMFDGSYPVGFDWTLWWYFSRFTDDHAVYSLSRPRGLPEGHTIADMADDYAAVLDDELGPASVLGVSMGGMIGLELAVRRPDLVETLVLANSGCRFGDPDALRRFLGYASDHDWARIRAGLAAAMFSDWRAVSYPPLAVTLGRVLQPEPAVPTDVTISLDAIREYDATDRLDGVEAPTLVFGGTDDPYFPEPILDRTADGIPDADRSVVRGRHAAFHERKFTFDSRVDAFLDRPTKPTA
jgi:pimeloyl-ACP methyl ester carboxylesterase